MIAIPNMDKPKSCKNCPIRTAEIMGVYYDSKSDEFKRVKITGCNESKYHTKTLGEGYEMMYKDCPLIEIDHTNTELLEFFNEFKKWKASKEVAKYINAVYGERKADDNTD